MSRYRRQPPRDEGVEISEDGSYSRAATLPRRRQHRPSNASGGAFLAPPDDACCRAARAIIMSCGHSLGWAHDASARRRGYNTGRFASTMSRR